MENLLLLLAVLACPLAMYWMMRSVSHGGGDGHDAHEAGLDREVSRLRDEVARLEEELSRRRARDVLSNKPGNP